MAFHQFFTIISGGLIVTAFLGVLTQYSYLKTNDFLAKLLLTLLVIWVPSACYYIYNITEIVK